MESKYRLGAAPVPEKEQATVTQPDRSDVIGVIGGTGPQGRGLAARWARAGYPIRIGSRTAGKAEDVAAKVRERAGEGVEVEGGENLPVAEAADIVVITVPYSAQEATLRELRDAIGDKLVVNVVNPLEFDDVGPKAIAVEAGSAAEESKELLPDARIVSAFHDVPAARLWNVDEPVACDVLICGDDPDANHRVAHLAADIPGMWGIDCGPLRNSAHIENMTPVILFVNRYYGIKAGLKIDGIERDDSSLHARRAADG